MALSDIHNDDNKYYGFYRALVIEVNISEGGTANAYGAVRVHIPDVSVKQINTSLNTSTDGIVAYPANSPFGGYNAQDSNQSSYAARAVYTPLLNSYWWVFFEGGDLSRCFYFSPWHGYPDSNDANSNGGKAPTPPKLPPECQGSMLKSPNKVMLIGKSGAGRSIVISDDENTPRVAITGQKRSLSKSSPEGDENSVYTIDGNQSVIMISEVNGKEQILIRTYKGDYLNIDVANQSLSGYFKKDISFECGGNFSVKANNIQYSSSINSNFQAGISTSIKSGVSSSMSGGATCGMTSKGVCTVDAAVLLTQTGCSLAPNTAASPTSPTPNGFSGGGSDNSDGHMFADSPTGGNEETGSGNEYTDTGQEDTSGESGD